MIFVEFDLSGAEWNIVAHLANDPAMLAVVESGKSPHVVTGSLITKVSEELVEAEHKLVGAETDPAKLAELRKQLPALHAGTPFLPRSMSCRQAGKKSNHGLNYGMAYRRFALENEIQEAEAKRIVEAYSSSAYPRLQVWWTETRQKLRLDRTLENCLGRKVRLLEEWGNDLFQAAYSFKPQSTVADVINKAMIAAYNDTSRAFEKAHLAVQVHDSLLFEHAEAEPALLAEFCLRMQAYMSQPLHYSGIEFTLGVDMKIGKSWGAMKPLPREDEAMKCAFADALAAV